jgi:hypothetical protein
MQNFHRGENDVLVLVASGGPKHRVQAESGVLDSIDWIHIDSADRRRNWAN